MEQKTRSKFLSFPKKVSHFPPPPKKFFLIYLPEFLMTFFSHRPFNVAFSYFSHFSLWGKCVGGTNSIANFDVGAIAGLAPGSSTDYLKYIKRAHGSNIYILLVRSGDECRIVNSSGSYLNILYMNVCRYICLYVGLCLYVCVYLCM